MIDDSISIHDKKQFEIKLEYQFRKKKTCTSYLVEMFMFMPNSLGINSQAYSKDDFYSDLQVYIRFKTPTMLLQNIVEAENSSLSKLKNSCLKITKTVPSRSQIKRHIRHIKMFCCIFKSAIRDHVKYTAEQKIGTDVEELVNKYIESVKNVLSGYRNLRPILNVPIIPQKVFSRYSFGDEYISLLTESYTFSLIEEIKEKNIPDKEKIIESLLQLIKEEIEWRKEHEYKSIASKNSNNEVFLFRNSVLKKYMSNVLFLNTRLGHEAGITEQLIYGLTAGIAMFFATTVAFYSQYVFGKLTFPLFIALIISYIFKDRIKDLLRIFLKNKLRDFFPDFNRKIYADSNNIGLCKEFLDFANESEMDQEILDIRGQDHITEIENGWMEEKVICYTKQVKLFMNNVEEAYCSYKMDGINDIMRFNVMKFQSKMDDPKKSFFVLNENSYDKIKADRVYHLNLILRYKREDEILYKRFRIILTKNKIKEIEQVAN